MKKSILLAVLALTVTTLFGCSSNDVKQDGTTQEESTTKIEKKYGPVFDAVKEKYYAYIADNFKGEPKLDEGDVYVFHVNNEDGEVGANLGFVYYDTEERASQYMETSTLLFAKDDLKEYKAGDEGILYASKADSDDATDTEKVLPSYIFVRQGTTVYYAVYYGGYQEIAEKFIQKMTDK